MKRKLVLVLLLLVVAACVTAPANPKTAYLQARIEFNTLLRQYLSYYNQATTEVQVEWKEKVDSLFKDAGNVLDLWGAALKQGQPGLEQQQRYLELKNKLLDALVPILGGSS